MAVKVLIDHSNPFLLAHGGVQIQIEQTLAALARVGVEAAHLRWWDDRQEADVIHFFGLPGAQYAHFTRSKKIKLVASVLLGGLGARPRWKQLFQRQVIRVSSQILPSSLIARTGWDRWQLLDAYLAVTPWEATLMSDVFQAPPERVHAVPNGVDEFFFAEPKQTRGEWLVTTASILPVKRIVETATAAVAAGTPYWVIGRPFTQDDPYYRKFTALCEQHPKLLRYEPVRPRQELAAIYRQARGFVLLSRWESLSLSAIEAAACECPLLLNDLPWARSTFGETASYCPLTPSTDSTAAVLRRFYDKAPSLPVPTKPKTWTEVAASLKALYEKVLA